MLDDSLPKGSGRPSPDKDQLPRLALVIPALCEAGNLKVLLERIRRSLDPLGIHYEVIIVDDDSRDGTDTIVTEIGRKDSRVRLLTRIGVRGLAGAVIYGWQRTDAEILGVMDADLQHPPELLPELWRELEAGADVVIGSRYAPDGGRPSWNRFRHLISQLAIWMTLPLQRPGIRVKDPMSGFFLLRRTCIQDISLQPQGFKILLEILVRGKVGSATEIPFVFGTRQAGSSKAGLQVGLDYLLLLRQLWKTRRK
jgi:dolichol-phosphate mannosyltransferase